MGSRNATLQSCQLDIYGREMMKSLFGAKVLVSGMQGFGVEIDNIDPCLAWALSELHDLFEKTPAQVKMYLSNPSEYTNAMKKAGNAQARDNLERVLNCLDRDKCETFEDCITWARLVFEDYFVNRVKQLIFTFPEDAATSTEAPFWSAQKRFPTPLQFSTSDAGHLNFVTETAILRSETFGIPVPEWVKNPKKVADAVDSVIGHDFQLKEGVKVVTDENATSLSTASVDDADVINDLITKLERCRANLTPTFRMKLEKDNDANYRMDVITGIANMMARNYSIPEVDRLKAKFTAGRIIAAIATLTAMASGLICLELFKILDGGHKLEDYRNIFANSDLPLSSSVAVPLVLEDLYDECLCLIFSYVPLPQLVQMRDFNNRFRRIISSRVLLKLQLRRSVPQLNLFTPNFYNDFTFIGRGFNTCLSFFSVLKSKSVNNFVTFQPEVNRLIMEHGNLNPINLVSEYIPRHALAQNELLVAASVDGIFAIIRYFQRRQLSHDYGVVFWNPTTNQRSDVIGQFSHDFSEPCFSFTLGYDGQSDTYKLVAFRSNRSVAEFKILDMGGDGNWRDIAAASPRFPLFPNDLLPCPNPITNVGCYVSGSVHWLTRLPAITDPLEILALDMATEEFSLLATPVPLALDTTSEVFRVMAPNPAFNNPAYFANITVLMGLLSFSYTKDDSFVLWIRREGDIGTSWEELLTVELSVLYPRSDSPRDGEVIPLYLSEDDGYVLLYSPDEKLPFLYNWRHRTVRDLDVTQGCAWALTRIFLPSLIAVA